MSMAKTVTSTTVPVARATRRSLIGGAALSFTAAASAVGITAGLAASVADLAEPPFNPDAALIALCREYVEHSVQHSIFCAQQDSMRDQRTAAELVEWERLDDLVVDLGLRLGKLEDQISELPALSLVGQRAKAEVLLDSVRFISPKHGGTLARSLAHDLVGRA